MAEAYQELASAVAAYQKAKRMEEKWAAKAAEIDKIIVALTDEVAQQRTATLQVEEPATDV